MHTFLMGGMRQMLVNAVAQGGLETLGIMLKGVSFRDAFEITGALWGRESDEVAFVLNLYKGDTTEAVDGSCAPT